MGAGPGRGDPEHWRFETYDLAPLLKPGPNVIAATVWNFGLAAPMAQMTRRTGFLLQADDPAFGIFNTGGTGRRRLKPATRCWPTGCPRSAPVASTTPPARASGGGRLWDWGWDAPESPEARWIAARENWRGHPRSISEGPAWMLSPEGWLLVPNPLPPLRHDVPNQEASPGPRPTPSPWDSCSTA